MAFRRQLNKNSGWSTPAVPASATYIFSKWKNAPSGSPVEFYSELDSSRYEIRKIEVHRTGVMTYAENGKSTGETRLGIIPVPPLSEIKSQPEFDIKEISAQEFEEKWKKVAVR